MGRSWRPRVLRRQSLGGTTGSASRPASTSSSRVAQAIAQFVRRVVGLLTAVAGGDRARRGDAGGAGETEELPTSRAWFA